MSESRVDAFVTRHFQWPGVLSLQRAAFGWDLLRSPCNVVLAVPAFFALLACFVLAKVGAVATSKRLLKIRWGFVTDQERAVSERLCVELLGRPRGGSTWQDLLQAQPFSDAPADSFAPLSSALASGALQRELDALVRSYAATRRAAADLTTAIALGASGLIAFGSFTPGAMSAGRAMASDLSHRLAIEGFALGPTLGRWYYAVVPNDVPVWIVVSSIVTLSTVVSLAATFAGLVADPLQSRLGIHQRRLRRWLVIYGQRLSAAARKDFKPWDPYVARFLDLVDVVKFLGPG
ncbi:MAG: hypothetical protein K0U93_27835 [Gammaproteobacteria bacterium]|nr:hypothetical protein [Gammaproteobacteria bacterium]